MDVAAAMAALMKPLNPANVAAQKLTEDQARKATQEALMSEEIPAWARDRMVRYCEEIDERPSEAFARYIAAHEQPPVDPEWEAMFQALRAYERVRANGLLSNEGIAAALTAFRKHKEAGK